MSYDPATAQRIKHLLVEKLHLEGMDAASIDDHVPLFGDGLGLDSVDALPARDSLQRRLPPCLTVW